MADELIIPNWHVILVHAPLALLIIGTAIELFAAFWPNSSFRVGGQWMILIGALASVPTALSGIYALSDVVRMTLPEDEQMLPWREMLAASPIGAGTDAWEMLERHAWLNGMATVIFAFVAVVGLASRDLRRAAIRMPLLLLLLIGVGLIVVGAWYGGETIYRHGVSVIPATQQTPPHAPDQDLEEPGEEESEPPPTALPAMAQVPAETDPSTVATQPTTVPATAPTTTPVIPLADATEAPVNAVVEADERSEESPADAPEPLSVAAEEQASWKDGVEYVLPPLQVHIVLAGVAISVALAAIGLSFRASNVAIEEYDRRNNRHRPENLGTIAGAFGARPATPAPYDLEPPIMMARTPVRQVIPASRFWLLSSLVAIGAALVGAYVFLDEYGAEWPYDFKAIWTDAIYNPNDFTRRFAHIVAGGVIIVVPFFAAIAARWMPRQKWMLALLSLLLILAVAAQVWLGILLTWDTADGSVRAFQ